MINPFKISQIALLQVIIACSLCVPCWAITYTITVKTGVSGSVSPATIVVVSGSSQTFTIKPATGYVIAKVMVDNISQGAISTFTFENITSNHTLELLTRLEACHRLPVRIASPIPLYFATLQEAYNSASDNDIIQAQAQVFTETLTSNRDIRITLEGGYNCDYTSNLDMTTINGSVRSLYGNINMRNIRFQ